MFDIVICEVIYIAISILVFIIFIVILGLIIGSIIGIKNVSGGSAERGHDVIKTIYIYFILFVTLMMTIGGSVTAFMSAADIISPPAYYQTFDQYKSGYPIDKSEVQTSPTPATTTSTLSDAELRKQYDQMVLDQKTINKNSAMNSLIKSFGWIIIPLPIFLFFQRKIGKQPVQP